MRTSKLIINLSLVLFVFILIGYVTNSYSKETDRFVVLSKAKRQNRNGANAVSKHKYEIAISKFSKAIEIYPEYINAYNNRGKTYIMMSEYDKAILDFTTIIELSYKIVSETMTSQEGKPDYPALYGKIFPMTVEEFKQEFSTAYESRGVAYSFLSNYDNAISDYGNSIEIMPSDSSYHNRGGDYIKIGEYDKGINDYYKSLEINPEFISSLSGLAWILATCKDEKYRDGSKAVTMAQKAVEKESKKPEYLDSLAAAYAETGQFEKAIDTQEKAISLETEQKGETDTLVRYQERLALYKDGKPYRYDPTSDKDARPLSLEIVKSRYGK